jgi:hypothetical protein
MTERPEGTPEASPDEPEAPPEDETLETPTQAEATPEAPPEAEIETAAPEAAAAAAEELETQAGAFEPETDAAAVDEMEAELEAEEATEEELDDEEVEAAEAEDEFEPGPASAAAGVAADAAGSAVSRRRGAPAASVQRAPTQSELAVRVTDNASRFFVIGTVVVFVTILLYGLLAGSGGLLTATPAPPTAAPSVSAEVSASPS